MPGRNLSKDYLPDSFYHIYNRGVNKAPIFLDDQDKVVFLALLKRYLGDITEKNIRNEDHPNYQSDIELLAFCLMRNHFHLFIYQMDDENAITKFMRSLGTSYSMYFNKRYKRLGPLFQQRYKAIRITDDAQFIHISRYIHLNPKDYKNYEWSSYKYYQGQKQADWVKPGKILDLFNTKDEYQAFVDDYVDRKEELDILKDELADY